MSRGFAIILRDLHGYAHLKEESQTVGLVMPSCMVGSRVPTVIHSSNITVRFNQVLQDLQGCKRDLN